MSPVGFVIIVYSGAIAYAGFVLGSKFNTLSNMWDKSRTWIVSKLSKK